MWCSYVMELLINFVTTHQTFLEKNRRERELVLLLFYKLASRDDLFPLLIPPDSDIKQGQNLKCLVLSSDIG